MGVMELNNEFEFARSRKASGGDGDGRENYDRIENNNALYYEIQETRSRVMFWFLS